MARFLPAGSSFANLPASAIGGGALNLGLGGEGVRGGGLGSRCCCCIADTAFANPPVAVRLEGGGGGGGPLPLPPVFWGLKSAPDVPDGGGGGGALVF